MRRQMKTVDYRYELEGRDRILELPGEEKRQKRTYTQESEQAVELGTSR